LGFKTALLGGRLSSEFAWFHMTTTNVLQKGGTLSNGTAYYVPIGSSVQEGVDGDLAVTLTPGWQVIGSFYAGHDRDQSNNPVSTSYDNSWSLFTRYAFPDAGPLRGLAIGGGAERVGSRWIQNSGTVVDAVFSPLTQATGEVKVKAGTMVNGFITYVWGGHWSFKVSCANILDEAYPLGVQGLTNVDPSPPRTFSFLASYKL
jgi:iron complex outermembrane receptor protein